MKIEEINLPVNAKDALDKLSSIRDSVQQTVDTIKNAGLISTQSFDRITESIGKVSQVMGENLVITKSLELARSAMAVADEFATQGVRAGIDSLIEHIGAMTENETVTTALELARTAMTAVDWLANDGLGNSINLISEHIAAFGEDIQTTLSLLDVRNSMTDAEGNFSIEQAASTAATIFNTAMKWQDILMSKKAVIQSGIETLKMVANGAKAIASFVAKAAAGLGAIIMSTPIVGIALGAAAVAAVTAGVIALKSKMPAMATGGVVSSPTLALVGEGRYPEAVVPLGNSPQFNSMKEDIANAVLQGLAGISSVKKSSKRQPSEVAINIDGVKLARVLLPQTINEQRRTSRYATLRGV
jgi:hypothetical protein